METWNCYFDKFSVGHMMPNLDLSVKFKINMILLIHQKGNLIFSFAKLTRRQSRGNNECNSPDSFWIVFQVPVDF